MVSGSETGREGGSQDGDSNTKGSNGVFTANGKDHFVHPLWKILAAALALPLGGAFIGGIVSYRAGLSAVDSRISDHKELNGKLTDHENRVKRLEEKASETKGYLDDIFCYITKGKDPRCK